MKFKRIYSESDLYDAIWVAFYDDIDLVEKFHRIQGSFENCVADTFLTIQNATLETPTEWYQVINNDEIIGYVVSSKTYSFLYSFGINEKYRNVENLEIWFEAIKKNLGYQFTCALWAKNVRAIKFLTKNGMKLYKKNEDALIFKYN